jgi:hypothetical protein
MTTATSPGSRAAAPERTLWITLAAAVVLGPVVIAAWFGLCPQYGNPGCPNPGTVAVYAAFRSAPSPALEAFLALSLVTPYLYPLSYIALGVLAMKRAPWLGLAGMVCGWLGSVPWGPIADQSLQMAEMARAGHDALFAALEGGYGSSWQVLVFFGSWVGGHLLGYVLLGVALARSRAAPRWAGSW